MEDRIKKYFKNPRKIKNVQPIKRYVLLITFDNGEIKEYNMANELTGVFSVLKQKDKFKSVFINDVGNVAWNIDDDLDSTEHWENQIDLCKDMLYLESTLVKAT